MRLFFDSLQEFLDILRLFTINVLVTNRSCVNELLVFTRYMYKPPIIQKSASAEKILPDTKMAFLGMLYT